MAYERGRQEEDGRIEQVVNDAAGPVRFLYFSCIKMSPILKDDALASLWLRPKRDDFAINNVGAR